MRIVWIRGPVRGAGRERRGEKVIRLRGYRNIATTVWMKRPQYSFRERIVQRLVRRQLRSGVGRRDARLLLQPVGQSLLDFGRVPFAIPDQWAIEVNPGGL